MKESQDIIGNHTISNLISVFDTYKNKSNSIEIDSLQTLLKNELHKDMNIDQVIELMGVIDIDGNGTLELDEFLEFMRMLYKYEKDEEISKEVFRIFDREENGYISAENIYHIFMALGENISLEDIEYVMKKKIKRDMEGDGNLNFQDFQALLKKYEDKDNLNQKLD